MRLKIATLMFLMLPVVASAGGWQELSTASNLVYEGEDDASRAYVMFATNFDPDSCTNGAVTYKRIYGNTQKGKGIVSMLLLAIATGKTVQAKIEGCDDWGRAVITGLRLAE